MPELIYKELGETSYQCIERLRKEKDLGEERLSFAGRLDPMAEGWMLVLVGEENNRREEFLGLDKEYEVEFVVGIETDSFDLMGKVLSVGKSRDDVKEVVEKYIGKQTQKFPPFSKKHVKGKAMFVWATEGRLDEIEIPEHQVEIYDIKNIKEKKISGREIVDTAKDRISKVVGDFRQEEILKIWEEQDISDREFVLVSMTVSCGTGTYIRQLVQDIGKDLGTNAFVFHIRRTHITPYI